MRKVTVWNKERTKIEGWHVFWYNYRFFLPKPDMTMDISVEGV